MTDLTEPDLRAALADELADRLCGRRAVIVGPFVQAGATPDVAKLHGSGCPVLLLSTATGAGEPPTDCEIVELDLPETPMVTEELRAHDGLLRHLRDDVRARIDAFDPAHAGSWFTTPFVTTDEPIDRRPVTGGRPASFLALEDKMHADAIWDGAGVARARCNGGGNRVRWVSAGEAGPTAPQPCDRSRS